ncbi:3-isopropylmalate dehydratase small subunit [Undibacterium sp. TJN25]|uniref:3-isopropylmalate dehydratase small subunit n=1 Tax=Undibacterium sp. TJN25 TaxID=3413056 RepID=UPI003BF25FEA
MRAITIVEGLVAPLRRDNVDTDAILPKQFMKSVARTGFGPNLFDSWRYLDTGEPGQDTAQRPLNREFVLNQPRYQGARILLAGRNFGCGSSREHAPWALLEYGFDVIVAHSFADIFRQNCCKNGILPVELDAQAMSHLFAAAESEEGCRLRVDLERQRVDGADGFIASFDIEPFTRDCLLKGLDEISLSLRQRERIAQFERTRLVRFPWLATPISD